MKISIKYESILALVVLLPYIEIGPVVDKFSLIIGDSYFKLIVFLLAGISIFINLYLIVKHYKNPRAKLEYIWIFLLYILIITLLQNNISLKSLSAFLWLITPIVFAFSLHNLCSYLYVNLELLIIKMINIFSIYVIFAIFYNVFKYGLFLHDNIRMTSTGGGSVIFGYSIAFMFSILLCFKSRFNKKKFMIIQLIFLVGSIATGSRGSMWPIITMCLFDFVFDKPTIKRGLISMITILILLLFDSISILEEYAPRILNLANSARNLSNNNLMNIIGQSSVSEILFGYGVGNVFPYQKWVIDVISNLRPAWDNYIYYKGYQVLVQPHNSYLYLYFEYGLLILLFFIQYFVNKIIQILKNRKNSNKFYGILPILIFLFINIFDSILFVQPGTVAVMWFLIIMITEMNIIDSIKKE